MKITSINGLEVELRFDKFLGACRDLEDFELVNRLGEGTYGVVYRAHDSKHDKIVALKALRTTNDERRDGIPLTALREISLLKSLRHRNVVNVLDIAVGSSLSETHLVLEYAEQDLAHLLDVARVKYSLSEVKCLFRQLLSGLDYLHRNSVVHRDIKLSNLLVNARGTLKIADFGIARAVAENMTPGTTTIWYRAPELLLGTTQYAMSVDVWSAGCILGELLIQKPVLPGNNEFEQLDLIVNLIGTPNDTIWPGWRGLPHARDYKPRDQRFSTLHRRFKEFGEATVQLLNSCLTYDPSKRTAVHRALQSEWFTESPRPAKEEGLPTFPESRNEKARSHGSTEEYIFDAKKRKI